MDEEERRRGDRKEREERREVVVEGGSRSIERMNKSRFENYIQSYKA